MNKINRDRRLGIKDLNFILKLQKIWFEVRVSKWQRRRWWYVERATKSKNEIDITLTKNPVEVKAKSSPRDLSRSDGYEQPRMLDLYLGCMI